jgi:hypothetical protein
MDQGTMDADLVAEIEDSGEGLSAQVNPAPRVERARRRQSRTLSTFIYPEPLAVGLARSGSRGRARAVGGRRTGLAATGLMITMAGVGPADAGGPARLVRVARDAEAVNALF